MVPGAAAVVAEPRPEGTGLDLLLGQLTAGYFWIKIFKGSIRHGLACKRFGSMLTLVDPNGCVWSGDYKNVIAMYLAFARMQGFDGWFVGASYVVCRINGAAVAYLDDFLSTVFPADVERLIKEYL